MKEKSYPKNVKGIDASRQIANAYLGYLNPVYKVWREHKMPAWTIDTAKWVLTADPDEVQKKIDDVVRIKQKNSPYLLAEQVMQAGELRSLVDPHKDLRRAVVMANMELANNPYKPIFVWEWIHFGENEITIPDLETKLADHFQIKPTKENKRVMDLIEQYIMCRESLENILSEKKHRRDILDSLLQSDEISPLFFI